MYICLCDYIGTIPTEVTSMTNLQILVLGYNELTGRYPHLFCLLLITSTTVSTTTTLTNTYLYGQILSLSRYYYYYWTINVGTIPTELGDAFLLEYLDFDSNNLTGEWGRGWVVVV